MNRKLLLLGLIPLALCLVTTSVSASGQIWTQDVGKDSGSASGEYVFPLPPQLYPFTQYKIISSQTWEDHWVTIQILDASWNIHLNVKGVSRGTVQAEFWLWNDVSGEWTYAGASSQLLSLVWGFDDIIKSGTETYTKSSMSKETFEASMMNPMTGEWMTNEYTVIRHLVLKWTNGELTFDKSWEIEK